MPLIPKQEPPYYENENGITTKQYIVQMTQSGTDAPTVVEIKNTIGNIIWTRDSAGYFKGTLTGAFPANKTTCQMTQGENWSDAFYRANDNTVEIYQVDPWNATALPIDGISQGTIIITTYP